MEENKLFKPFVPDESKMAEFTLKSILLGSIFGIIFGFVFLRYQVPQYEVNATILIKDDKKDTKIDKEFFVSLIHTLLAFIVNIILGAYVIYVSKILQLIELPTDMNKYPYINQDPNYGNH